MSKSIDENTTIFCIEENRDVTSSKEEEIELKVFLDLMNKREHELGKR